MLNRRDFAMAATSNAVMIAAGAGAAAASGPASSAVEVSGPVAGGRRGHIFGGFVGDIGQYGYVEEEFFISGEAQNFAPVGPVREDGLWTVRPLSRAPFKTRVVVHRPRDPAKFNGAVVCEWTNVSAGFEISLAAGEGYHRQGFAYAAISAQPAGLDGFPGQSVALRPWDGERYGTLSIPGDSYSFDIFTQVARALGPQRARSGIDPMGGLSVKQLFAQGASQSATRMTSYTNAIQPLANVFSGIIIVVGAGYGTFFDDFVYDPSKSVDENATLRRARIYPSRIRPDSPVPVIYVNSQTETMRLLPRRQPDSEHFRFWEVAGACHASAFGAYSSPDFSLRDGLPHPIGRSEMVDLLPTMEAGAHDMLLWTNGGPGPVEQQPLLVTGNTATLQCDDNGNALGGVRLPEVEVPTATYDADNPPGRGTRKPFPPEKLKALYPTSELYVEKVRMAAEAAEAQGVIPPYRTQQYVAAARRGFDARA